MDKKLCGALESCFDNSDSTFGHMSYCMCDYMSEKKVGNKNVGICGKSGELITYYSTENERVTLLHKILIKKNILLIKYIKLLTDELDDMIGIAHIHHWRSKRIKEGIKQRKEIEKLYNKKWEDILK